MRAQAAQPFGGLGVIATAAVMDDANARAFLDRVPDVLGDLQVAQHGAIGALLVGLAQVHVSNDTRRFSDLQVLHPPYMYLCNSGRYLAITSTTP